MTLNKLRIYLACALLFLLCACGAPGTGIAADPTPYPDGITQGSTVNPAHLTHPQAITVFAAASLTDAFLEIGQAFEGAYPGVTVNYSFAGSQVLRTQLEQGASADVVAFADQENMALLVSDALVASDTYSIFATNRMIVILPASNPAKLKTLADLARPGIQLVLADNSVPAGRYARQILSKISQDPLYGAEYGSQVLANVVSNETDVRQVVTKVELGEADAGIVYASDELSAESLITIPIPAQYNVIAQYPIAPLSASVNHDLAAAFIAFSTSQPGQEILSKWGFTPVN